MNHEFARYAAELPTPELQDAFAVFALRASADALRGFIRYQLQMKHRGFTPLARPARSLASRPMVLAKKSEAA